MDIQQVNSTNISGKLAASVVAIDFALSLLINGYAQKLL